MIRTTQPPRASRKARPQRAAGGQAPIDLALQGGGAQGAFTWGVLDRLLEDETLPIDGVCGTSAGALNAAVMACGWARDGRAGAREALAAFWRDVGGVRGCFGSPPAWDWPWGGASGLEAFNLDANPWYRLVRPWLRMWSPYQLDLQGRDPLGDVLRRHVDPALLRRAPLKLFVVATSVTTGQPRVFTDGAVTIESLLASACLPQLFRAVEIDGEPYWDGGYSGNPALWPLIYDTDATDVLLVRINPLRREGTPRTAETIADRVDEITFNAGLVAEMRAIHFVQRLLADQRIDPRRYKSLRLHMVADDDALAPLTPSSKLNTDWRFLQQLHALGRQAAERWLAAHRGDIGRRQTVDIADTFLHPVQRQRRG